MFENLPLDLSFKLLHREVVLMYTISTYMHAWSFSEHNLCALLVWLNLFIYFQLGKLKLPVGSILQPFSSIFSFHAFTISIVLRIDPPLQIILDSF